MFCDEGISPVAGADSARLQISEIEAGDTGAAAHHRNDCRSASSGAFHPAAAASSARSPGDASCRSAGFRTRKANNAGSALRRLRSEQADDRAPVPGRNENDIQSMAPATETAARDAV